MTRTLATVLALIVGLSALAYVVPTAIAVAREKHAARPSTGEFR